MPIYDSEAQPQTRRLPFGFTSNRRSEDNLAGVVERHHALPNKKGLRGGKPFRVKFQFRRAMMPGQAGD